MPRYMVIWKWFRTVGLTTGGGFVHCLIEAGAKLDHQNNWGHTALIIAANDGKLNIVRALIQAGADLNSA